MDPVRNLQKILWYVYVLESLKDKLWYTGCTNNITKRTKEHNDGKVFATKNRRPFKLIYFESSYNKYDAFFREKYLKSGMGKKYLKNRLKYYYGAKNK
jgi:putative endonuclease